MKRLKLFLTPCLVAMMLFMPGCKKFLDVNKNVNNPVSVPVSTLLTSGQQRIGSLFALGGTVGNGLGVYTHQLMQYGGFNRYGIQASGMNGTWSTGFSILTNLDVLIDQATTGGQTVYAGIGKILKAYLATMMVDIWGEMPYTEANKFREGIKEAKFDKGQDIYAAALALLDEGIANVQDPTPQAKPSADDLVYKGNTTNWVKAANTIKLKLYTQVRLVQNVSAQVTALLAAPASLINTQAEGFVFPFGPFSSTDDRYPGYGDYSAAQRGGQIPSHWLYEIMKGYNPNINTNIVDPRIPYYFYKQKTPSQNPENCTDYRDGGFITLIFGSNSPCVGGSNSNTYTLLGIYPIGGRFDDESGAIINAGSGTLNAANAGTGAAPQRALTYADRLYLEAELINAGVASGDQRAVFSSALNASFAQVDYVISTFIKPIQAVPTVANQAATTTYKAGVLDEFDAANDQGKLEHIMTQKWISRLGNSLDNYTDYRRTKFPVMFTPAPANGGTTETVYSPGGTGGLGEGNRPVSNGTPYPISLPFPQSEIDQNRNTPAQKVLNEYKIFWLP